MDSLKSALGAVYEKNKVDDGDNEDQSSPSVHSNSDDTSLVDVGIETPEQVSVSARRDFYEHIATEKSTPDEKEPVKRLRMESVGAENMKMRYSGQLVNYTLEVLTGDVQNAGTMAQVYVTLRGDAGDTQELCLSHEGKGFLRNHVATFHVTAPDIGEPKSMHVRCDGTGYGMGWYLAHVLLSTRSQKWKFECNRWLAVDEDDGKTERDVTCSLVSSEEYTVEFVAHRFLSGLRVEVTGLWASAVFPLTLQNRTKTDRNKFSRHYHSVFSVTSHVLLGEITRIRVVPDGLLGEGVHDSGVMIESVIIRRRNSEDQWTFECNRPVGGKDALNDGAVILVSGRLQRRKSVTYEGVSEALASALSLRPAADALEDKNIIHPWFDCAGCGNKTRDRTTQPCCKREICGTCRRKSKNTTCPLCQAFPAKGGRIASVELRRAADVLDRSLQRRPDTTDPESRDLYHPWFDCSVCGNKTRDRATEVEGEVCRSCVAKNKGLSPRTTRPRRTSSDEKQSHVSFAQTVQRELLKGRDLAVASAKRLSGAFARVSVGQETPDLDVETKTEPVVSPPDTKAAEETFDWDRMINAFDAGMVVSSSVLFSLSLSASLLSIAGKR